jgi:class 3 adenylate cyclase
LRKLGKLDVVLIVLGVPAWLAGVGLHVSEGLNREGHSFPFAVAGAPDPASYPVVEELRAGTPATDSLAIGDQVLAVGDVDLRGVNGVGFLVRAYTAARHGAPVSFRIARSGSERDLLISPVRRSGWWSTLPFTLTLGSTALFLLVRAPNWSARRRFYVLSLLLCLYASFYRSAGGGITFMWVVLGMLTLPVAATVTLWSIVDSVESDSSVAAGFRAVGVGLGLVLAICSGWMAFFPAPTSFSLTFAYDTAFALFFVSATGAVVWLSRLLTPLQRRQGKWIGLGVYTACVPFVAVLLAVQVGLPAIWEDRLLTLARVGLVAVPIGILVSVIAYDFLDIDRVIGASATYTLLGTIAAGAMLTAAAPIAEAASGVLGVDDGTGRALASVLLASVVVPLYRYVRPRVDRVLLAERHALELGFGDLVGEMDALDDVHLIPRLLAERLDSLLLPENVASYVRRGEAFEALFVRGRAVPPAFDVNTLLISALEARTEPLVAARWARAEQRSGSGLTAFDRAVIETLDIAVVLPIRGAESLVGFICLGPKRSGDIYSSGDIALLAAASGRASARLRHFSDEQLLSRAREMQDALQRYVPEVVVDELESGGSLDAGECDVTVLFVDIRGYVGIVAGLPAKEIFSTVNDYTQCVSSIVSSHGGAVVEFNGDGMMAVFGAPRALPKRERAAVSAAREVVKAIADLPVAGAPLSVGVGVASGPAFAGDIRSADRLIWSVIGNTTNLAARLQGYTREIDAAIAVDEQTWRRSDDLASDFVLHSGVSIRGREPLDVYALPLPGG